MIHPGFLTSPERRELAACVRSHREDHGVGRRANAILLLDDGKSCQMIAEFLYLDDDTVRGWYNNGLTIPFSATTSIWLPVWKASQKPTA